MIVLVLLLERQHQFLEARVHRYHILAVYLLHSKESVLFDDGFDEFGILRVILICVVLQVVHPIILWVVFDVGQLALDLLDD